MELVCILCPKGCPMSVSLSNDGEWFVTGNECKRGEQFAIQENISPMRIITTSVWVKGGDYKLVSVKTDKSIPKAKAMEVLQETANVYITAPVTIGQIIIKNVAGLDANIVATRNIEKR